MNGKKLAHFGLIVAAIGLGACRGEQTPGATPTMSSEQVLATAQGIAEQTRSAASPTASPTPITPSPTIPQESPTLEATSTPTSPRLRASYNANVRSGPGEEYEVIDVLLQGQEADVLGRYDDTPIGTWYFISRSGGGLDGWVWSGAVILSGNAGLIPFRDAPPTSTPVPGPTQTPTPTPSATVATP
jgi:hypothetical protein